MIKFPTTGHHANLGSDGGTKYWEIRERLCGLFYTLNIVQLSCAKQNWSKVKQTLRSTKSEVPSS